ncbi:MAG: hypothetical protein WBG13_18795, partial [Pseudolabrys sp.]
MTAFENGRMVAETLASGVTDFALPTANSFLDSVIDQFADAIARMAETLGDELDRAEDHVLHQEPDDERQRIGRVRLQAVRVHRQL